MTPVNSGAFASCRCKRTVRTPNCAVPYDLPSMGDAARKGRGLRAWLWPRRPATGELPGQISPLVRASNPRRGRVGIFGGEEPGAALELDGIFQACRVSASSSPASPFCAIARRRGPTGSTKSTFSAIGSSSTSRARRQPFSLGTGSTSLRAPLPRQAASARSIVRLGLRCAGVQWDLLRSELGEAAPTSRALDAQCGRRWSNSAL